MICQEPSMDRRRPHTGEKGRYGIPRSATLVVGCTMRDIEEALIRSIFLSSNDKASTLFHEQAKLGTSAALHRNYLHTMYSDEVDVVDLLDHMRDELEKLMSIYPNVYGTVPEIPQRRASDRRQPMTVSDNFDDQIGESIPVYPPEGIVVVHREIGCKETYTMHPTPGKRSPPIPVTKEGEPVTSPGGAGGEYDGWTEQQKLHGRMNALGIPVPRPSLWSRFKKWVAE